MARGGNQAIEAVGRSGGDDDDGLTPALRAWKQSLEAGDGLSEPAAAELDPTSDRERIAEDERRAGRLGATAPAQRPFGVDLAAATGAAAAAIGAAQGAELRQQDRMAAMAAMHAEALARFELAPHADEVNAAIRDTQGLDDAPRLARQDEHGVRQFEGTLTDREQQKAPGAIVKPDDYVSPIDGPEHRSPEERREDAEHFRRRGIGNAPLDLADAAAAQPALDPRAERGLAGLREQARGTRLEGVVDFLEQLARDPAAGPRQLLALSVLRKVADADSGTTFEMLTIFASVGGGQDLHVGENRRQLTMSKGQAADLLSDALMRLEARAGR